MYNKGVPTMPRSKNPDETRKKVIDAGWRTFQEKGYEASTILEIVANMDGLTRGAFYHHFKSKEEVLTAICERIFYQNNPFEKVRMEKNLNGLEKLRKALILNMTSQRTDFALLNSSFKKLNKSPRLFMWHMEFNASLCQKYVQPLIEEGITDGSIKTHDAQILAELFIVLFSFWLGSALFPGDVEYVEKKAETVFAILEQFGINLYNKEFNEIGKVWTEETVK
jgi:AcrR family transcriptional regulator